MHSTCMRTVFDWLSVILFCAIALTLLHRSMHPPFKDRIVAYLPPACGCALGNWLGNEGYHLAAILTLIAAAVFYQAVLDPWQDLRGDGR